MNLKGTVLQHSNTAKCQSKVQYPTTGNTQQFEEKFRVKDTDCCRILPAILGFPVAIGRFEKSSSLDPQSWQQRLEHCSHGI